VQAYAGEHGGKEHGGKETGGKAPATKKEHGGKEKSSKEHGGEKAAQPSSDAIRTAMSDFVTEKSKASGTFDVEDPDTGKTRKLTLEKVHERVGKTGDYYYSCADFKDSESGEMLDLDLDVEDKDGKLMVVDVRIHKLDGKARYTYDEKDNRIPLEGKKMPEGSGTHKHDEGKEHGGKETGGKAPATKEHGGKTKEHGGS